MDVLEKCDTVMLDVRLLLHIASDIQL